jgi:hypothetical protein
LEIVQEKMGETIGLFNGHFIEAKALYALEFDAVCCVSFIVNIDTSKAFAYVKENFGNEIEGAYQHAFFDHNEQKIFFNNTIFILKQKKMIELGINWCQILHTPQQHRWANATIKELGKFRVENKEPAIGFARRSVVNDN